MPTYAKPYLTVDQQVALLRSRGMQITDLEKAKICLGRIGYYRLSAYWYPFRKSEPVNSSAGARRAVLSLQDEFKDGTSFVDILGLYVFDKKLRLLVLDALERVEVGVRTDIALRIGRCGSLAHRDPACLHGNFTRPRPGYARSKHQEWLARLDDKFEKSKEDFADHFKQKYPQDDLPIWMAVELWDFGALSHFFAGMKEVDKDAIANTYSIKSGRTLGSWLRCLNDVRNTCAHHSRLWNRPLVSQPRWPATGEIAELDHLVGDTHGQTRLYAALLVIRHLLRTVNPSTSWGSRLTEHLRTLPDSDILSLASAGFPNQWEQYLK